MDVGETYHDALTLLAIDPQTPVRMAYGSIRHAVCLTRALQRSETLRHRLMEHGATVVTPYAFDRCGRCNLPFTEVPHV